MTETSLKSMIHSSNDEAAAITVALKVVLTFSEQYERDQERDPSDRQERA